MPSNHEQLVLAALAELVEVSRKSNELLEKLILEVERNTIRTAKYPSGGGPY